jgi:hypothetical protein
VVMAMPEGYLTTYVVSTPGLMLKSTPKERRCAPDEVLITRLKEVKLGSKDQLAAHRSDGSEIHAA